MMGHLHHQLLRLPQAVLAMTLLQAAAPVHSRKGGASATQAL